MTSSAKKAFDRAVAAHDESIKRHALAIWVGNEPTFTDRFSEAPEWLTEALGPSKKERAQNMLAGLRDALGGVVLRTLGRQYPKEDQPRWSLGLYKRRDGQPLWAGPPDPLLGEGTYKPGQIKAFWKMLARGLRTQGWYAVRFKCKAYPSRRIAFRRDGQCPIIEPLEDPRLVRPSIHYQAIPAGGLPDELAEQGIFLVSMGYYTQGYRDKSNRIPCVEMPAFPEVKFFLAFLEVLARAALEIQLERLVLTGFPPPVDASVSWSTLTPDPAVVEVNMAPAPDAVTFLGWNRILYTLAEKAHLSPYRLHYNGQLTDSGGGGQLTLGGPDPGSSPFLLYPQLLPNLSRYFNRHPCLSFYFASDFVGGCSQSPRPDERFADVFEELDLALELLARQETPRPEMLWASLAPFLADFTGNAHRSEINIEKLWNPYLHGRGRLGLVEFRAFRMPRTAEKAISLAALLRAIAAMLILRDASSAPLVKWGSELHDRFALPFYLQRDLREVLDDLTNAGLGLDRLIVEELLDDSYFRLGSIAFQDCHMTVRRALEFWPLVGDTLTQDYSGSRLVDASTARLEISLRTQGDGDLSAWSLSVDGYRLPLRFEEDEQGPVLLFALRYRRYKPWHGLHPALDAHGPIEMILANVDHHSALKITYYEWKPQGGGYAGLPQDLDEARRRHEERLVVERLATIPHGKGAPPVSALTPYCLDLRRL